MAPRISLIHATPVSMDPIKQAFARDWPEAVLCNLLEDSLSPDRAREATLTEAMTARIVGLAKYAASTGSDAVLFTCSAFGPAIELAAKNLPIPVLKPNEAMFESALGYGDNIGMLATFQPAVATMEEEFREDAARHNSKAKLKTILVPGAIAALNGGDVATHNRLVQEYAPQLADCDAIILAHFSMARAADAVRSVVKCPVLTSPDAALKKVQRLLKQC